MSIDIRVSLVTVGSLNSGAITSGFGDINNGSSTVTTGRVHFTAIDGSDNSNHTLLEAIAGDTETHAGKFFYVTEAYDGTDADALAAFSEADKFYFVEKGGVFPSPFLAS